MHEDLIADIMMFHMVGYTRVRPRFNLTPDISTNGDLQVAKVKFKHQAPSAARRPAPPAP